MLSVTRWAGIARLSALLLIMGAEEKGERMKTYLALFNRFELELTEEQATDCSHQGACDADVEFWADKIHRPDSCTPEALAEELGEYGAWEDEELQDDSSNWHRIVWLAAGNIREDIASGEACEA